MPLSFADFPIHFNSQPHKEADLQLEDGPEIYFYFNSQPHKEADVSAIRPVNQTADISTHSLTRRLTKLCSLQILL